MKNNNIHPKTEFLEKQYQDTMEIQDEVYWCCAWCGENLSPHYLIPTQFTRYVCDECGRDNIFEDGFMHRDIEIVDKYQELRYIMKGE